MNILIGCEFSGRVRDAFSNRGHFAVSCDRISSLGSGEHFRGDVLAILDLDWDMVLAFPPCTYLASSGARWWKGREREQQEAIAFVEQLMNSRIERIAIENPIGILSTRIRKPDQIIQPWMFGEPYVKSTCLWLKNLPKLEPTQIVEGRIQACHNAPDSKGRSMRRSITYKGIAQAMAEQWG